MRFRIHKAAALPALLLASAAAADGVCENEYRSTPAEAAAMGATLTTLMTFVPDAPDGWTIEGDDQPKGWTSYCLDGIDGPLPHRHTRRLRRTTGGEAREAAFEAAGAEMRASIAKQKPQMDALQARLGEVSAAFGEAAVKGDTARVAELQAEMAKLNEEFQALLASDDSTAKFQASAAAASRDFDLIVDVAVNPNLAGPDFAAERIATPPGAAHAFRWSEGYQGHVLVLVGEWKSPDDDLVYELVPRAGAPKHAPHGIVVTVEADVDRLDAFVRSVDFAAMARTLGQ